MTNNRPPKFGFAFLKMLLRNADREDVITSFEMDYESHSEIRGSLFAFFWIWSQILRSIIPLLSVKIIWSIIMLKNYMKIAFRNMKRNKGFTLINLLGLTTGMVCFLFTFLYVFDEINYDSFQKEDVYRVVLTVQAKAEPEKYTPIPWPAAAAIKENFPQVEKAIRLYTWGNLLISYEDTKFYESKFIYADSDIFDVLSFPFISGNPETALDGPETVVISEKIAQKYFGDEDPIGKTLHVNTTDFQVNGVYENTPTNTHLKFDFLASMQTIYNERWMSNWFGTECYTYIKLKPNSDIDAFKEEFKHIGNKYVGDRLDEWGNVWTYSLQPIEDIHLKSNYLYEIDTPGNAVYVYFVGGIGFLILLIAGFNFMNLMTARSANRAKEVGVRKVIGAARSQLVNQFLGETIILSIIAGLTAFSAIYFLLPMFNELTGKEFTSAHIFSTHIYFTLAITILFIGLTAGSYPALFLSTFKPAESINSSLKRGSGIFLRRALVIGQYAITVCLVLAAFVMRDQINFMKGQSLGFDKEQKLVLPIRGGISISENYEMVKKDFSQLASVKGATASSSIPGKGMSNYAIQIIGQENNMSQGMYHLYFDDDFIPEYNIEIIAGRAHSDEMSRDRTIRNTESGAFVINEAAVKALGWNTPDEAIGKILKTGQGGRDLEIIGVVKDFHFAGLQSTVEPLVMEYFPRTFRNVTLTLNIDNLSETVSSIENKWKELYPENPFVYFFLSTEFDRQYRAEDRVGKLFNLLTFLGLFIASLGLFGLASFMAEQRTKEIGIRKVLGASAAGIVLLLSKEFTKWIILANLLAWPIAYWAMNNWLQNFAYQTNIAWYLYLSSGVITLAIALIAVGQQALKSAKANPVNSLKHE